MDFKNIHLGKLIEKKVVENKIEEPRICRFFKCSSKDILEMYQQKSLDSEIILKWCKLLDYDFFRIYTQHLILYSPSSGSVNTNCKNKESDVPQFRKNIYTKEIIDFILELIESKEKTALQIVEEYRIPKTTIHRWISKYKN